MKKIKKNIIDAINYIKKNPDKSITDTAKLFNIDRHTLSKYKNYNFKEEYLFYYNEDYYILDEKELEAISLYKNEQINFSDIKNKYGYKQETFKKKLLVCKISSDRKYNVNFDRNLFSEIKTSQDSYWLGFILADGYLNTKRNFLRIKLGKDDKNHLFKFCDYAKLDYRYIKTDLNGVKTKKTYYIELSSKNIVDNLVKCGLFQGKSLNEKPYLNLNQNLTRDYIRGIWDGDGWISKKGFRIGVCGSIDVLIYIENYLKKECSLYGEKSRIYNHGKIKKIDINNKKLVIQILDKIYFGQTHLDRKYNLVKNLYCRV